MAVASAPAVAGDVSLGRLLQRGERRDLVVRHLRARVARQYGLSPADLAPLPRRTLTKMAALIEAGQVRVTVYRVEH